jgi:hypothetical protein
MGRRSRSFIPRTIGRSTGRCLATVDHLVSKRSLISAGNDVAAWRLCACGFAASGRKSDHAPTESPTSMYPTLRLSAAASKRVLTPSLVNRLCTWFLTV